jgi:hypothetical protein
MDWSPDYGVDDFRIPPAIGVVARKYLQDRVQPFGTDDVFFFKTRNQVAGA